MTLDIPVAELRPPDPGTSIVHGAPTEPGPFSKEISSADVDHVMTRSVDSVVTVIDAPPLSSDMMSDMRAGSLRAGGRNTVQDIVLGGKLLSDSGGRRTLDRMTAFGESGLLEDSSPKRRKMCDKTEKTVGSNTSASSLSSVLQLLPAHEQDSTSFSVSSDAGHINATVAPEQNPVFSSAEPNRSSRPVSKIGKSPGGGDLLVAPVVVPVAPTLAFYKKKQRPQQQRSRCDSDAGIVDEPSSTDEDVVHLPPAAQQVLPGRGAGMEDSSIPRPLQSFFRIWKEPQHAAECQLSATSSSCSSSVRGGSSSSRRASIESAESWKLLPDHPPTPGMISDGGVVSSSLSTDHVATPSSPAQHIYGSGSPVGGLRPQSLGKGPAALTRPREGHQQQMGAVLDESASSARSSRRSSVSGSAGVPDPTVLNRLDQLGSSSNWPKFDQKLEKLIADRAGLLVAGSVVSSGPRGRVVPVLSDVSVTAPVAAATGEVGGVFLFAPPAAGATPEWRRRPAEHFLFAPPDGTSAPAAPPRATGGPGASTSTVGGPGASAAPARSAASSRSSSTQSVPAPAPTSSAPPAPTTAPTKTLSDTQFDSSSAPATRIGTKLTTVDGGGTPHENYDLAVVPPTEGAMSSKESTPGGIRVVRLSDMKIGEEELVDSGDLGASIEEVEVSPVEGAVRLSADQLAAQQEPDEMNGTILVPKPMVQTQTNWSAPPERREREDRGPLSGLGALGRAAAAAQAQAEEEGPKAKDQSQTRYSLLSGTQRALGGQTGRQESFQIVFRNTFHFPDVSFP